MKDYDEHTTCPISGSREIQPLKGYEKHYLVKSKPLGFVFCSRIPTQEELIHHYSGYNRQLCVPQITLDRYQELLNEFEKFRVTGNILDVGCGMGDFLQIAKEAGWKVFGTEFTDEAIVVCQSRGIDMHRGPLSNHWFQDEQFDVITSFEVIEHINNPRQDMDIVSKKLRTGGVFYCTTPNFNALERRILKSNYNNIEYPEHLCYYTKKTLNYLMKDFGLEPIKVRSHGISFSRIIQGLKNSDVTSSSYSNADQQFRDSMRRSKILSFIVKLANFILNATNSGNALKGLYQKK